MTKNQRPNFATSKRELEQAARSRLALHQQRQARTFTDHRGQAIELGSRVLPISWGSGLPQWLVTTQGTVVGFGQTRVLVKFDMVAYEPGVLTLHGRTHHAVNPDQLRVL